MKRGAGIALTIVLGLGVGACARVDPAPPEMPKGEPPENTLRWTTASEVDNFGYWVYRGASEEGPFERLNAEPIAGAGTTDLPTSYEFVDATIDPARTYYYYIESISMSGVTERFTPVVRKGPKISSEP